ncbi:hypothetical protein EV426DRAFT_675315 [Tirmania nivea]|nr:hypothetical protein EV426DRAFT_675315 [Tirmania nivea]
MPSKFGIRKRIRQLFHHSSKKSKKADLSDSYSTTEYNPPTNRTPSPAPTPPPQLGGINEPYELHHPSPALGHLNLSRTSSYQPSSDGEPLGAGLNDALYPPNNYCTVQSAEPSLELREPNLDRLGDLGPSPPRRIESHIEDYFALRPGRRPGSADQQRKENNNRTRDLSDLPPEAINVLPEPPRLELHSSDKILLATGGARLRRLRSRGQQLFSSSTRSSSHQNSAIEEGERSSFADSGSVYSRNCSTDYIQGSHTPSDYLNHPELPAVGKHIQESPVLGGPEHRSKYAAMVDHLTSDASQEAREKWEDDPSRYEDSVFGERRHTLGTPSPHALDQYRRENFQGEDSGSAQLRGESLSQSSTIQGKETPHPTTSVFRHSPIGTGLPPAYHHDAEIYHTHVPSVTHSIDKHVSYNSPIIHERTILQHRETRHEHIIRDIHTYEIKPTLQPVVKPEYLTPKHVVQLESGGTRDITAEEAMSGNYRVLSTENRVIIPTSVRNFDEYSDQVRDMDTSIRIPSGQEGNRYSLQECLEGVPYENKRGAFGHVQDKP